VLTVSSKSTKREAESDVTLTQTLTRSSSCSWAHRAMHGGPCMVTLQVHRYFFFVAKGLSNMGFAKSEVAYHEST